MDFKQSKIKLSDLAKRTKFHKVKLKNIDTLEYLKYNIINTISSTKAKEKTRNQRVLSYQDYDKLIDGSLKKYNLDNLENEDEEVHRTLTNTKISLLSTINNNNLFSKKNYLNTISPEIKVSELNFRNPFSCSNILKNNNLIYNEICKGSLKRQENLYLKSIQLYESSNLRSQVKAPGLRICRITAQELENPDTLKENKSNISKRKGSIKTYYNQIPADKSLLKLFYYMKYPTRNYPEGRDQFSLCLKDGNIILTGGICRDMKKLNIWSFNVNSYSWKKIEMMNSSLSRYGHTSVIYQGKIYMYGGRVKYANSSVVVDLEIINLNEGLFTVPDLPKTPEKRRNHICTMIGNKMFVHGGVNEKGEILNDSYILGFSPLKWQSLSISILTIAPKLFGHTCCLVMPWEIVNDEVFSIYKLPETSTISLQEEKIKQKGIYVFGGRSSVNEYILSNDTYLLTLGQKPLNWKKLNTLGKPPPPRYYHTMNFYEKGNFIIIHGGRNDLISKNSGLKDTFILNLENLNWLKINLFSNDNSTEIPCRFGHSSVIVNNKLLILGGMNNKNILGSSFFTINLDFGNNSEETTFFIDKKNLVKLNDKDSTKKEDIKSNNCITKSTSLPTIY